MEKNYNRFVMSFIDKSMTVNRHDRRMVANLKSGFKFSKFDTMFDQLGFRGIPPFAVDILEENGYKKDYDLKMWVTKTTGVAKCSTEDDFDEVKGRRIAVSRAKKDAYIKALSVMCDISNSLWSITNMCDNTMDEMLTFSENEDIAIENVIEYGVSNPTK